MLNGARHVKLRNCMCVCVCERERERERGWVGEYLQLNLYISSKEIPTDVIKKRHRKYKHSNSQKVHYLVNKQTKHTCLVITTRSGSRRATYHKLEFTRVFAASVRTQRTTRCLVPGPHVLEQAPHGRGSQ
jgi:hypothetical protein